MASSPLNWKIEPKKRFERDLKKVDDITHSRVADIIREISVSDDPTRLGNRLKSDLNQVFCIRIGKYRLKYTVDRKQRAVGLEEITKRDAAYDRFA